jgi:hypothetical protein
VGIARQASEREERGRCEAPESMPPASGAKGVRNMPGDMCARAMRAHKMKPGFDFRRSPVPSFERCCFYGVTVRLVVSVRFGAPGQSTEMTLVPCASAVAIPFVPGALLIVAVAGVAESHVQSDVMFCDVPFE